MATTSHSSSAALSQRLADSGLRSTPQREVVYDVLLNKRDHPTADEVFARVKAERPGISLATVYNCLETLVQCGLVRSVNFERGPTHYCPNLHPHAHFHDEITGATYDVDLPPALLAELKSTLPQGYDAKAVEITFRGSASSPRGGSIGSPDGVATNSARAGLTGLRQPGYSPAAENFGDAGALD